MTNRPTRRAVACGLAVSAAGLSAPLAAHAGRGTRHDVRISAFAFVPETIEAREGDVIRWLNEDLAPHTATATDHDWDTGGLETGEAAEIEVSADMTKDYYCVFHPMMKARIVILE